MQYKTVYTEDNDTHGGVTFVRCSDNSYFESMGAKWKARYIESMINNAYEEGRKATENQIKQLKKLKSDLKRLQK